MIRNAGIKIRKPCPPLQLLQTFIAIIAKRTIFIHTPFYFLYFCFPTILFRRGVYAGSQWLSQKGWIRVMHKYFIDYMKDILDFYMRLAQNNNKVWFDGHRDEYEEIKKGLASLAQDFILGIEAFDPRCKGLQVKDCTYRINRDIRFSKDKRPYKDWHGIYVCPKGKKSGMAGYYLHLEPANNLYFICGGLYNPSKEVVHSIREQIMLDPCSFHDAVLSCGDGFKLNWDNALKRMPYGYKETDRYSQYYRLRSYEIYRNLTLRQVLSKNLIRNAVSALKHCHKFNELLNKCFDYAYDKER